MNFVYRLRLISNFFVKNRSKVIKEVRRKYKIKDVMFLYMVEFEIIYYYYLYESCNL